MMVRRVSVIDSSELPFGTGWYSVMCGSNEGESDSNLIRSLMTCWAVSFSAPDGTSHSE